MSITQFLTAARLKPDRPIVQLVITVEGDIDECRLLIKKD